MTNDNPLERPSIEAILQVWAFYFEKSETNFHFFVQKTQSYTNVANNLMLNIMREVERKQELRHNYEVPIVNN